MPVIPAVIGFVTTNAVAISTIAAVTVAATTTASAIKKGKLEAKAISSQEELALKQLKIQKENIFSKQELEEKAVAGTLQQNQIETLANLQASKNIISGQQQQPMFTLPVQQQAQGFITRFNNWFNRLFGR